MTWNVLENSLGGLQYYVFNKTKWNHSCRSFSKSLFPSALSMKEKTVISDTLKKSLENIRKTLPDIHFKVIFSCHEFLKKKCCFLIHW